MHYHVWRYEPQWHLHLPAYVKTEGAYPYKLAARRAAHKAGLERFEVKQCNEKECG